MQSIFDAIILRLCGLIPCGALRYGVLSGLYAIIYTMYYVIQHKHNNPRKHFVTYKVPKFITAKNSDTVIFEFKVNGVVKRKWAQKKEIILLTDNKEFYDLMIKRLTALEQAHLKKIEEAETELQNAFTDMLVGMTNEFEKIDEKRRKTDAIPCLLKSYL